MNTKQLFDLTGKVAIISGGSMGLGLQMAEGLAEMGANLVLCARKKERCEQAAQALRSQGIQVLPLECDVRDKATIQHVVDETLAKFGRLDILINNAGVGAQDGMFVPKTVHTTEEELQTVFGTNLFATIAVTRSLLPLLKKSDAGRIVNLSSILGSLTLHADPNSLIAAVKAFAYDASKTALNAFTIHLAAELKDTKIKVNSAHPGWVKTEMGTDAAPMEIPEGAKTSVDLALLGPDGPSGRFIHLGQELPW